MPSLESATVVRHHAAVWLSGVARSLTHAPSAAAHANAKLRQPVMPIPAILEKL